METVSVLDTVLIRLRIAIPADYYIMVFEEHSHVD